MFIKSGGGAFCAAAPLCYIPLSLLSVHITCVQNFVRLVRTGFAEELFIERHDRFVLVALADLRLLVFIIERLGALGTKVYLPARVRALDS